MPPPGGEDGERVGRDLRARPGRQPGQHLQAVARPGERLGRRGTVAVVQVDHDDAGPAGRDPDVVWHAAPPSTHRDPIAGRLALPILVQRRLLPAGANGEHEVPGVDREQRGVQQAPAPPVGGPRIRGVSGSLIGSAAIVVSLSGRGLRRPVGGGRAPDRGSSRVGAAVLPGAPAPGRGHIRDRPAAQAWAGRRVPGHRRRAHAPASPWPTSRPEAPASWLPDRGPGRRLPSA